MKKLNFFPQPPQDSDRKREIAQEEGGHVGHTVSDPEQYAAKYREVETRPKHKKYDAVEADTAAPSALGPNE